MIVDFHSVYQRYAQDVYRFALYLSGDVLAAEEIVQETFVRAWVTPGEITVGTVKAYLFMIARNLHRSEMKRTARNVAYDETQADSKPGPPTISNGRLELQTVLKSLESLSAADRAALLMHAWDDMPHAEIAAVLGLSVAAVKVRIHRARLKLNAIHRPEEDCHERHS